jgi:hypothetical protein
MLFSPLPCYLVHLRPKYSPQHLILKHPMPTCFPEYTLPFYPLPAKWPADIFLVFTSLTIISEGKKYESSYFAVYPAFGYLLCLHTVHKHAEYLTVLWPKITKFLARKIEANESIKLTDKLLIIVTNYFVEGRRCNSQFWSHHSASFTCCF